MPIGLVISCLHHRLEVDYEEDDDETLTETETLTEGCEVEVHRMLRLRALDFNLNPDLEESCRADLGRFCSDDMPEKGSVSSHSKQKSTNYLISRIRFICPVTHSKRIFS